MIPHKSQRPLAKVIPSLLGQLPDIHPNTVIFVKHRLHGRFIFTPEAVAPSLNMSRPSAKTRKPVSISISPVSVVEALFPNTSYAFRIQGWFYQAREDVVRLSRTPPLDFCCLVGSASKGYWDLHFRCIIA
jgi:hypothetical protein